MAKEKIIIPLNGNTSFTNTTADIDINLTLQNSDPEPYDFPEEPIGARLILDIIDTSNLEVVPTNIIGNTPSYKKKGSNILLTEDQVKQMREEMRINVQPAHVLAVGLGCSKWITDSIHTGDIVRVFLNQCEASVDVEGKSYVIYPERCIISKVK